MSRSAPRRADGFSLVELIIAVTLLLILTTMALPLARIQVQRQKEQELRYDLREMRDAIDNYKDAADRGAFQVQLGTDGYPPDLQALVTPIQANGKTYRFLRRIPVDPMTNSTDWGLRSTADDPESDSWGGQNVFDVYTKSDGTALNGTKYHDW